MKVFQHLKQDVPAGIVVFLVAVPLCLGIALASGAPLFSGIIAGIVGGTVVALASGSPLGVSGPAAGLAVIVLTAIQDLGAFETFLLAVVIAGLIQMALGFARAGIIGYYFPNSVIKGMLAGIGVIIILKQIPHALGYDSDYEGDLSFFQLDGENTFSALGQAFSSLTLSSIIVSVLALAILILWEQPFIKKIKITQIIQGPLVAVISGIVLFNLWSGSSYAISSEHMVALPVASDFGEFIVQFSLPDFSQISNPQVYTVAITLAIVASLETLLCVEATDKLDPYKRITPTNRELKAQGLGNFISGLIGGLPVTQVIVRSSANIQSGGRTKMSAFVHGILLLLSVALIPFVLNMIPLASLAAILIVVGFKLAKPSVFKEMYAQGMKQFIPFIVTILAIVFTDLLMGIAIGMAVAVFYILLDNYNKPFIVEEDYEKEDISLVLAEDVTFLNKASIQRALDHIEPGHNVIIDASKSINIHPDIVDIIHDFEEKAAQNNIGVKIMERKKTSVKNQVAQFQQHVQQKTKKAEEPMIQ